MERITNKIVISIVTVILLMAIGYSAFATQLTVNGTTKIGIWDVRIIDIYPAYTSEGCRTLETRFTNTSIAFKAQLTKPGDYITYLVTIENAGTINAILNKITFTPDENGSPAINYIATNMVPTLDAGDVTYILIRVMYDENATEVPEIKTKTTTGIIEYIQEP